MKRKVKEAILAFRIERALSKQRILELYLNQIYLGSGAYGVAAASLEYFDKSIQELDYGEAALLAALPKAPSRYNPYRNIELAKFRRDLVLKNLFENKYIDLEEYNYLKEKKISVDSPIGKGLLGKKVGDVAEINTPGGLMLFEILEITR